MSNDLANPAAAVAAVIGSFRQHHADVQAAVEVFQEAGYTVSSPKGRHLSKDNIPFVRYDCDPDHWSDPMVQVVAMHRILRASFVFVVAPDGYVGRTTCYEIGRIIHARRPLYFSARPQDLPLHVPETHIESAESLASKLKTGDLALEPLHVSGEDQISLLEGDLLDGQYRDL